MSETRVEKADQLVAMLMIKTCQAAREGYPETEPVPCVVDARRELMEFILETPDIPTPEPGFIDVERLTADLDRMVRRGAPCELEAAADRLFQAVKSQSPKNTAVSVLSEAVVRVLEQDKRKEPPTPEPVAVEDVTPGWYWVIDDAGAVSYGHAYVSVGKNLEITRIASTGTGLYQGIGLSEAAHTAPSPAELMQMCREVVTAEEVTEKKGGKTPFATLRKGGETLVIYAGSLESHAGPDGRCAGYTFTTPDGDVIELEGWHGEVTPVVDLPPSDCKNTYERLRDGGIEHIRALAMGAGDDDTGNALSYAAGMCMDLCNHIEELKATSGEQQPELCVDCRQITPDGKPCPFRGKRTDPRLCGNGCPMFQEKAEIEQPGVPPAVEVALAVLSLTAAGEWPYVDASKVVAAYLAEHAPDAKDKPAIEICGHCEHCRVVVPMGNGYECKHILGTGKTEPNNDLAKRCRFATPRTEVTPEPVNDRPCGECRHWAANNDPKIRTQTGKCSGLGSSIISCREDYLFADCRSFAPKPAIETCGECGHIDHGGSRGWVCLLDIAKINPISTHSKQCPHATPKVTT